MFDYLKKIVEFFLRLIGPLFVLLAASLIFFVVYTHFIGVLPFYHGKTLAWSVPSVAHLLISAWLSGNISYNYLAVVFTKPGSPPTLSLTAKEVEDLERNSQSETGPRMCKTCRKPKPERAHHCHVCGTCVLKMDHHCPWVANCVGFNNHHQFVMFLFYLALGTGYAAIMAYKPFSIATNFREPWSGVTSRSTIIFSFVLTVSLFIAITILFTWQAFLILTGQTSIEFYMNKAFATAAKRRGQTYLNPYDLGRKKNFQFFFGQDASTFWAKWLVPFGPKPVGNGVHWTTRHDLVDVQRHNL